MEEQIRDFLIDNLDPHRAAELKEVFDSLDYSNDGKIKITDLVEVLEDTKPSLDLSEFHKMLKANPKCEMTYNQFLSRILSVK